MVKRLYERGHIVKIYPLPPHLELAVGPLNIDGGKRQWESRCREWKRRGAAFSLAYAKFEGGA